MPAQCAAVRAFADLPEASALAAANKRIINILKKSGGEAAVAIDRARLADGAEHDLFLAFQRLQPIVDGEVRSAFVMTEPAPGGGSDPAMIRTTAARRGA